jgi:hypothetical protein
VTDCGNGESHTDNWTQNQEPSDNGVVQIRTNVKKQDASQRAGMHYQTTQDNLGLTAEAGVRL